MKEPISIKLSLSGNIDIDRVTSDLNLTPSKVLRRGEPFSDKIPKIVDYNLWEYRIRCNDSIEDSLNELSKLLEGKEQIISSYTTEPNSSAIILIGIDQESITGFPSIYLSAKSIEIFGACDISIDIDIY